MSWTEKKISLTSFLGNTEKQNKNQDDGEKVKEDPKILRCGVLKKMKKNTQSKKFFVLYDRTSSSEPAKLVYFDSEKKHLQKLPPKREIVLEKCFNINRRQDGQDKGGKKVVSLTLYTLDDCVQISFDEREDELNDWLETMLVLQHGKQTHFGKKPKPNFDIIWQVNVKSFKPDDGNDTISYQWTGPHRLCVTPECVLLYPLGEEKCVELPHPCIRNIMVNDKVKVLGVELGRTSPIGSGLLSLESEERECVSQLHDLLRKAMIGANPKVKEDILGISQRYRSSSFSQDRGCKPRSAHIPVSSSGKSYRDRDYLSRNRTISEPVDGKPGHVTPEPGTSAPRPRPMSMRYSPGIMSPTSPVGSVTAGLSDDGTGSSNSIYDPTLNGDPDLHISYVSEVIPEESSGEVSIEFKRDKEREEGEEGNSSSLPRKQRLNVFHKKQPSLPDYMSMVPPPLPARNQPEFNLSTSLPISTGAVSKLSQCITSPTDSQKTSSLSSDYHAMGGTQASTPLVSPESNYLPMDLISQVQSSSQQQFTPPKSSSSHTLVPASAILAPSPRPSEPTRAAPSPRPSDTRPPAPDSKLQAVKGDGSPRPASRPLTVLTPPSEVPLRRRAPSGEAGYVIMSPGVGIPSSNLKPELELAEEPASLAALEESLGGRWHSSPRHASPISRHSRQVSESQRNSSCLDDNEAIWSWRLNEDPDFQEDELGNHSEDYMLVNYPVKPGGSNPRPISRISPASSSSAMSGTPSSGSRLTDLDRLERVQSFLRDEDEDKVTCRPPRGEVKKWGRHMDIPSSKSSSRSNISPFGRTPPSGPSGSPTVASRLEGWFRHRAGSVPNRPPMAERRRHRTQSEGEKDVPINK